MSETSINKPLETDWARVDAMQDDEIDTSDIPPLTDKFFKRAVVRLPDQRVVVTMHVDPEILAWFKAQGDDYEQRMHAALRIYAEAHRAV
ncbi:MAG: BrnA antitoxin family protein [Oscillochloridaceae bacterium umkhey_bin13]